MLHNTVHLAFVGAVALLVGILVATDGFIFFLPILFLYTLAFLFVSLVVNVGAHWPHLRPQLLYSVATLIAASSMLLLSVWMLKQSTGITQPGFWIGVVLLPYLVANAAAYWWVGTRKEHN